MQDIALHILDVGENAISAGAARIEIVIREDAERRALHLEIIDDGRGMDWEEVRLATDPFYTSKPGKKVGLGVPLLAQAAREAGGTFQMDSEPGRGTHIHAVFGLDHPDRKPLGDIAGTLELMQLSHPEVEFVLTVDLPEQDAGGSGAAGESSAANSQQIPSSSRRLGRRGETI